VKTLLKDFLTSILDRVRDFDRPLPSVSMIGSEHLGRQFRSNAVLG
jgi:hypothetical protein